MRTFMFYLGLLVILLIMPERTWGYPGVYGAVVALTYGIWATLLLNKIYDKKDPK